MINSESVSNRLKYAMNIRGIKQVELVEKTKIPKGSISQYVSGFAEPRSERIYLLAKALNVDPVWLMGMDVPMEPQKISVDYTVHDPLAGEFLIETADLMNRISVEKRLRKFVEAFISLPEDKKKLIEGITYSYLPDNDTDNN